MPEFVQRLNAVLKVIVPVTLVALMTIVIATVAFSLWGGDSVSAVFALALTVNVIILGALVLVAVVRKVQNNAQPLGWVKKGLLALLLSVVAWSVPCHNAAVLKREKYFREFYERAHRHGILLHLPPEECSLPIMWNTKDEKVLFPKGHYFQELLRWER